MKDFIAQKDEECTECGSELPKGSWINLNEDEDIILCDSCKTNYEECTNRWKED